MALSKWVC